MHAGELVLADEGGLEDYPGVHRAADQHIIQVALYIVIHLSMNAHSELTSLTDGRRTDGWTYNSFVDIIHA